MNAVDIRQRISQSAADFREIVWPHFSTDLGGGELVPVETVTDSAFATLLDTLGMTDVWQIVEHAGMRSLATRVQWGGINWRSWSIRCQLPSGRPTEWHKLTQYGEWQLPQYIIQSYLGHRGGPLLGAAAIKTRHLQVMLVNEWHGAARRNPADGTWFYPVWWQDAEQRGFDPITRP